MHSPVLRFLHPLGRVYMIQVADIVLKIITPMWQEGFNKDLFDKKDLWDTFLSHSSLALSLAEMHPAAAVAAPCYLVWSGVL